MKRFDNNIKNIGYFGYRLVEPVFDPIRFVRGLFGYFWYFFDILSFNQKSKRKIRFNTNLFPQLHDKTKLTPFDAHYYYQQLWAFEKIKEDMPAKHVDIASTYELSGYISKIVPTTFVDIRPIDVRLRNLEVKDASILDLPYEDSSLESISCLHVVEHIGLGRYGDPVDPDGMKKACKELSRVLGKGGKLYFSTPIGKERLCFNAHRISDPVELQKYFQDIDLLEFSVVDDNGTFKENEDPSDYKKQDYSVGLYVFTKK